MSSSSVNSAIRDGLRFRNIDCGCGKRASVRISESSLNKNKLYYCCAANRCGFFSWCLPINQRAGCERMDEVSQATSSKSMVDVEQLLDASQLLLDLHQLQTEMRGMRDMVQPVHRDNIQSLKKLLTIGLAVIVGLIVLLWYQIQ
jgi:hypothetical protein